MTHIPDRTSLQASFYSPPDIPRQDFVQVPKCVQPNVIDFTHPTSKTYVSSSGCNALSIVMVQNIS
jgi:hypothetical protein